MAGKPKPDTAEKAKKAIRYISEGMSERKACEKAGINRATFRACALRESMGDQYAKALEALAGDQVEKLEQAIDDMRSGTIDAQMARVEIDARKWFASKFLPSRYGDKQTRELTGPGGGPVEQVHRIERVIVDASDTDS